MINYKIIRTLIAILIILPIGFQIFFFINTQHNTTKLQFNNIEDKSEITKVLSLKNSVLYEVKNNSEKSTSTIQSINKNIKLPILMYHRINTNSGVNIEDKVAVGLRVSPEIFEKQLQFLAENSFTTINSFDIKNYLEGRFELPKKPILLTFDDGFKDNYEFAFSLLKKYKMTGDFGIITSVIGNNSEYVSWDNLKEMVSAGMSIASHTHSHCTTAIKDQKGGFLDSKIDSQENPCSGFAIQEKLTTGQIKYEYEFSKKELEKNLGIKVSHLIYPFGFYNSQAIEIAKNAGFTFATTVKPQKNNLVDLDNPFEIGRIRVQGQQGGELSGFFR